MNVLAMYAFVYAQEAAQAETPQKGTPTSASKFSTENGALVQ